MKWPWQKKDIALACILSPKSLDCFATNKKNVIAFQSYPLDHHEITTRIINSISLRKCINSFITEQKLNPSYFACALDSQLLVETINQCNEENSAALCCKQMNAHHWYAAHLTHEQRFTYQLFARSLNMSCMLITSTTYCLLSANTLQQEVTDTHNLTTTLESYLQTSHSESNTHYSLSEYTKQVIAQSLSMLSQGEYERK